MLLSKKWIRYTLLSTSLLIGSASVFADENSGKKLIEKLTGQATTINQGIDNRQQELQQFLGVRRDMLKGMPSVEEDNTPKKFIEKGNQPAKASAENTEMLIFISRSMSKKELKEIYLDVSDYSNTLLVYRWIKKDEEFIKGILAMQEPINKKDKTKVPRIDMNPELFKQYNITVVPTAIVLYKDEILLKATGLSSPKKIYEKIDDGVLGDAGKYGPVSEIIEIDMIELLKERARKIDWGKKKDAAVDNFWKNRTYENLPHAIEDLTYKVSPLITITKDIKTPEGKYIAKKGDILNPLKMMPWDKDLIIFDATSKNQTTYVKSLIKNNKVKNPIVMMTKFDSEADWDDFNKLQEELGFALFLVKPEVITRFELKRTPSIITVENDEFIINEVKLDED